MADLESLMNYTAREAEHLDPKIVSFLILSIVLSSLLNGAVLIVIYHQQNLQDYMRVLYQILTASDLILGITWSIWSMLWLSFSDHETCSVASVVFPFLTFVALWSVMACLCGISFNLYLLVTRPLRYHTIVTRKRFFCILAGTYLVIVLACGIAFPVPESPLIILLTKQCQSQLMLHNSAARITYAYEVFPICATMSFTTAIYVKLLFIAWKKANEGENVQGPRDDDVAENVGMDQKLAQPQNRADLNIGCNAVRRQRRRFKGLVTILLLTCSLCITWTPFLFSGINMNDTLMTIFNFVPLSYTWIQPIVYLLTNPEARMLFLQFVRCCRANEPFN